MLVLYAEHVEKLESTPGVEAGQRAEALTNAARFAASVGKPDIARGYYERALEAATGTLLEADAWAGLAEVVPLRERLPLFDKAIAIRRRQAGDDALVVALLRRSAEAAAVRGDAAGAFERYRQAVAVGEKLLPARSPELAGALVDLGFAYEQRERFAEAAARYKRALAIQEVALGARHPETAITLNNLAGVVGAQGDLTQAERLLRRALNTLTENLGPWHLRVAVCAGNLADLLVATRRPKEARVLYERAIGVYEHLGDAESAGELRRVAAELR
ncbi:MAG: tetratricopeptide repeat protein [Bryobacteraceae bacterium]